MLAPTPPWLGWNQRSLELSRDDLNPLSQKVKIEVEGMLNFARYSKSEFGALSRMPYKDREMQDVSRSCYSKGIVGEMICI